MNLERKTLIKSTIKELKEVLKMDVYKTPILYPSEVMHMLTHELVNINLLPNDKYKCHPYDDSRAVEKAIKTIKAKYKLSYGELAEILSTIITEIAILVGEIDRGEHKNALMSELNHLDN